MLTTPKPHADSQVAGSVKFRRPQKTDPSACLGMSLPSQQILDVQKTIALCNISPSAGGVDAIAIDGFESAMRSCSASTQGN